MAEDQVSETDATADRAVDGPLARGIARSLWLPGFKAANPDADAAAVTAAWQNVHAEHVRPVARALRTMRQRGYVFVPPAVVDEA